MGPRQLSGRMTAVAGCGAPSFYALASLNKLSQQCKVWQTLYTPEIDVHCKSGVHPYVFSIILKPSNNVMEMNVKHMQISINMLFTWISTNYSGNKFLNWEFRDAISWSSKSRKEGETPGGNIWN